MTNPAQTSLIDRANLDRDEVRREIARGLQGADDGELFLEYSQTEALAFDNGRLKQATYDTAQGFGLRAVKDDAVGYAHSSDVSLPALIRAAKHHEEARRMIKLARHSPLRHLEFVAKQSVSRAEQRSGVLWDKNSISVRIRERTLV